MALSAMYILGVSQCYSATKYSWVDRSTGTGATKQGDIWLARLATHRGKVRSEPLFRQRTSGAVVRMEFKDCIARLELRHISFPI
jgi:hypothetical protein